MTFVTEELWQASFSLYYQDLSEFNFRGYELLVFIIYSLRNFIFICFVYVTTLRSHITISLNGRLYSVPAFSTQNCLVLLISSVQLIFTHFTCIGILFVLKKIINAYIVEIYFYYIIPTIKPYSKKIKSILLFFLLQTQTNTNIP